MAKPRIIIADTDASYIIPLQLKFAEEFFDKVDLEIITDPEYFEKFFSVPQKAGVLIISEDLYSTTLQRHSINKIFLMMEQPEEESTVDLNVSRLYKYTSVKEIFNEIIGKSADALNIKSDGKNDPQIILISSASGGTGKTTVAMGISACLTKNYKKVLYINADHIQTFQRLLENPTPVSAADVYAKLTNTTETVYGDIKHVIRKELFSYLPPFKAALISLGLDYKIFKKIAVAAKKSGEYDFVVIDADTAFDENKVELLNVADKVITVTTQSKAAVYATNQLVANMNGINSDKYVFVCNAFDKSQDNALISPGISMKFAVSEYIEWFDHYDQMKCEDFLKDSGIQKLAFLML